MKIASKYTERLAEIKKNVETVDVYFRENNNRYHKFMKFVFDTALTSDEKNRLSSLNKPPLEFNILEAMVSRLRGEHAANEPSISVTVADSVTDEEITDDLLATISLVEAHIREVLWNTTNDGFQFDIFSSAAGGGFGVAEVYTDYVHPRSFDQKICIRTVFDPTLTGFDPLARESHKGDGQYCFKMYPMSQDEFKEEWGEDTLKDIDFQRGMDRNAFNWAYTQGKEKIVLICEYWEKRRNNFRLLKMSNGKCIDKKHYEESMAKWLEAGIVEQPPVILEERDSYYETIDKYTICGKTVLKHEKTDMTHLPLVFFDGNSVMIMDTESGVAKQMTRPYVYHAEGIQRLKNFAGQTVAYEIESQITAKFLGPLEGVPDEYKNTYTNLQQASFIPFNAFKDNDPNQPLPPPREVVRTPTPPIVETTFIGSDQITQTILGSYESSFGNSVSQASGKAVIQNAVQSANAASPYFVNNMRGLNRIGEILLDLIPKYHVTPRTIPIRTADGKRSFYELKRDPQTGEMKFKYDPSALKVKVEASVNTAVQKQMAIQQLIGLSSSLKVMDGFINAKGLPTIMDNLDIRGADHLKKLAEEYVQEQQQAAQENAGKQDPMIEVAQAQIQTEAQTRMAQVQQQAAKAEGDHVVQVAKLAIEQERVALEREELEAKMRLEGMKVAAQNERADAEMAHDAIKVALDVGKHHLE